MIWQTRSMVSSVRQQRLTRDFSVESTHTYIHSWVLCELPSALVFNLLTGLVQTKAAWQQPKRDVPLSTETPAVSPDADTVYVHPAVSHWTSGLHISRLSNAFVYAVLIELIWILQLKATFWCNFLDLCLTTETEAFHLMSVHPEWLTFKQVVETCPGLSAGNQVSGLI